MTLSIEDAVCIHETEKAILVDAPEIDQTWLPKGRHIDDDSEVYAKGHEGRLVVSDWIAEQKGWV